MQQIHLKERELIIWENNTLRMVPEGTKKIDLEGRLGNEFN